MRADDVQEIFESVDAEPSSQFSDALLDRLRAKHLFVCTDTIRDEELLTLEEEGTAIDLVDEQQRTTRRRGGRPNRRRIAVAVAAAVALIVGTGVIAGTVRDDSVEVVPPAGPGPVATTAPPAAPALPDGLKALPPEGSTPSAPETGALIAGPPVPIWVYEDGRVIFARWRTYDDWTGFLERRLTPEGVELVRTEILANAPYGDCGGTMGWYAYADGGRTPCERPGQQTYALQDGSVYPRLQELPYGAPSWLPASAWADPEPKPYVPSTYEVQIGTNRAEGQPPPIDVSAMRAALPPEAAELLTDPPQCEFPSYGNETMCFTVSTEAARQVAAAVGIAGPSVNPTDGSDSGNPMGGFGQGQYTIAFLPYLPHESPVFCCGG